MGRFLTQEEFVVRAKKVHGNRYDYSRANYRGLSVPVEIICPEHGIFLQKPREHIAGCHCQKCTKIAKHTKETFIEKAKEIHGDAYDYSEVEYNGIHEKVKIICRVHGIFEMRPLNHISSKQGCPKCKHQSYAYTTEEFVEKANRQHGDLFDYSKAKYVNKNTKVQIVCRKHGTFWQEPEAHWRGEGCPKCRYKKAFSTRNRNGKASFSQMEENLYAILRERFGNVLRNYREDNRYPFHCDFYVPERDMFIELNAHWTHGGHWFDEGSEEDIELKKEWENKTGSYYDGAIRTWTVNDVKKRRIAKESTLNYVVLWNQEDIDIWVADGFPDRANWQ